MLPTLDAVLATLGAIAGVDPATLPPRPPRRRFSEIERTLVRQEDALVGPVSATRSVRIMVTLPTEAATRRAWVRKLVEAGTDCVRINCAHDEPKVWVKMIRNVRAVATENHRPCKILMDLTGPRARTADVLTPAEDSRVHLHDRILLTRGTPDSHPDFKFQARCSLAEVFSDLKPKRLVCFNEGRIGAQVERTRYFVRP